eukprot:g737.t1
MAERHRDELHLKEAKWRRHTENVKKRELAFLKANEGNRRTLSPIDHSMVETLEDDEVVPEFTSSALGSLPSIEENAEPLDFPLEREIAIFLTSQVSSRTLDLTQTQETRQNDPSNVILWQAARRLSRDCRAINLSGVQDLSAVKMRTLALCLGEKLEAICVRGCPITDTMVESLVIRLFSLRYINLSGCTFITNASVKALSDGCSRTLTAIDLSRCPAITEVAISWIAGCVGQMNQPCARLKSLNLGECRRIRDPALVDLGIGCHNLEFLNCRYCPEITSAGVAALCRGCPRLQVVNFQGCVKLTNKAVASLGRNCHELQSLCLASCLEVTDRGLGVLGPGCPLLQSVNLAGCVKVSEGGVCHIVDNCKGLQMLNVTGCEDVTENGLRELLRGLPFVESAKSFVGFKPRTKVRHRRIAVQHKSVLDLAAQRIQSCFRVYRTHKKFMTAFRAGRRGRAAVRIQRVVRGNAGRARVLQMRHRIAQEAAAVVIQRWVKNRLNHFLQLAILLHRKIYETKVATIVICQALYRGRVARRKFTEVVRVMNKLRVERWEQTEEAVAVKLQGIVRVRRARNRLAGMMEEAVQRQRDVVWATRKVQGVWKVYYAKLRAFYVRREMQRSNAIGGDSGSAVIALQKAIRGRMGRLRSAGMRWRILWSVQINEINATTIQAYFRRHVAMKLLKQMKYEKFIKTKAAIRLQQRFRGHRIHGWKELRFEIIKNRVLERQRKLEKVVQARVAEKEIERIKRLYDDSCSDSDKDTDDWTKYEDFDGTFFWFSASRNQRRAEFPIGDSWEHGLVGLRVRVYWPAEGEWFEATVAKYHVKKNKHRIEYDDGDHEWLEMREEQERIMIQDIVEGEKTWIDFRFCRPDDVNDGDVNDEGEDDGSGALHDEAGALLLENDTSSIVIPEIDLVAGEGEGVDTTWVEYIDTATQVPYYVNTLTGESKWEI